MGFWGSVGGFLSSAVNTISGFLGGGNDDCSSSSHESKTSTSTTQTIYEPDRVKIAELERAKMDKAIDAQKEIMQMNAEMQVMIMETHQKGFEHSTKLLKEMMLSLNQIAQERLLLIENGHFEVVEKVEKLYMGLESEIREDSTSFNLDELPKMLAMLEKFPKDSASAKLYEKSIDKQIDMNMSFFAQKLSALHERQKIMVESTIKSKELVLVQSAQMVLDRMAFLDKQLSHQQQVMLASPHAAIASESQPKAIGTATPKSIEGTLMEE